MKETFLKKLDDAWEEQGFTDRSSFIRVAVRESLLRRKYDVPEEMIQPPSRRGKGGRPLRYNLTKVDEAQAAEEEIKSNKP